MRTLAEKLCGWGLLVLAVCALPCAGQHGRPGRRPGTIPRETASRLKQYQGHYYVIHTDLPVEKVREAAIRMKAMAEEYHRRTRGFAGKVSRRLPFYLFSNSEDYYAAGGLVGSAGVYDGSKLMAVASEKYGDGVWRIVQHEGFHQFARTVIRGRLPVWVNEGLAEYFGHGIWTGDGLVVGMIPPARMRRVQDMIKTDRVKGFLEMLTMTQREWNGQLSRRNYDQAWSMTHFLIHANDGKYRKAMGKFIGDIASGRPWEAAFVNRFGRDTEAFQKRYADWWLALPADPTPEVHVTATIQTLTSFLARATARKQVFKDFDEFLSMARDGKLDLATRSDQWLPAKLLSGAVDKAVAMTGWALVQKKTRRRWPQIVYTDAKGQVFTGSFEVRSGKAIKVGVVKTPPKAPEAGATKEPGESS